MHLVLAKNIWYNVEKCRDNETERKKTMEKKSLAKIFKSFGKKAKIVLWAGVGVLVLAVICVAIFAPSGETTFSVKTSLKEVLESSEMSTSEYTYNSIVKVPIDPSKPMEDNNVKYQIAYKGTVKSGFDFKKIDTVEKDDSIIVIIPKIEIQSVNVDTNLEYIFTKEKYDTEKTYAEAYSACCKDLEEKAKANKTLFTTAIDSAVETLTAITKPFEKQLEEGKTIQIVYIDNYVPEVE